ncbi:MAG: glycosyltransferase family 4 protein [Cyanobacteria bacterium P01_F01_bin.53]
MAQRILFMTHAAVLGGAELSLIDLANNYRETSEVLVFAHGPLVQALEEKEIPVTVFPASQKLLDVKTSSYLTTLQAVPNLFKLAHRVSLKAQDGFDVIHINSQKALVIAAIAARIKKLPPIVWHLRDILTANHFSGLNRRLAVLLANRCATKVIANSQATATAFVDAGGNPDLVEVVYNGISSEPFEHISSQHSQQLRQSLDIGDVPVIGVFSRLSFWKGQHLVLQALKQLPEFHAVIVGDALFGESEYVDYLQTLVKELNLGDRVHWLGFRRDIPELMKACDYIVHPSTQPEPFGRVLVEGLLAQRPVIAAAAGGALEIVTDGETGQLFVPNDSNALARTIRKLHTDPAQVKAVKKKGYRHARKQFSLEASLQSFAGHLSAIS